MRRIALEGLASADQVVLRNGGGVARTPEQYALLSTGWEVRPVGEKPHATTVKVWRGESITVVHCSGTPVSVRRGPEYMHIYGDWLKMVLPVEGSLLMRQGNASLDVMPGELASVAYREQFDFVGRPGTSMFLLYLSVESLRNRGMARGELHARKWTDGPLLPTLMVLLEQLFGKHSDVESMAVENALFEVTANLVAGSPGGQRGNAHMRARAIGLISANFHDPDLNADRLAAELGVSRRTLYALASDDATSIADVIRRRRISHARQLLESQPELSLRRVAKLCGFRGPDQFSRAFSSIVGMTPSAFRTSARPRQKSDA